MAAKIMKCGESRIWLDPTRLADIEEAITSADVRRLIKDGVIARKPKQGLSSFRKNKIAAQKKKGRRRNRGSVKGKKGTRLHKKKTWMKTIRSLRKLMVELKATGKVDNKTYRDLYTKSKSGYFRSKSHIMIYLERNNLLRKDVRPEAK
ncbi:MAG: 50S ribosomal protein L19, large subunit ribosomal protein L19e [archaeon GW2011_AR5]|nr:MAG: 50S ribosomal protein L19, large subunit ribosomal protein L19e [archaeon GW2011_AR5]